jgi:hypothetical protein
MTELERELLLLVATCVLESALGDPPDDQSLERLAELGDELEASMQKANT